MDDFLTAYGTGFRDEPLAEPVLTEDEAILRAAWERVREFLLLHVFDDFAPELEQLLREGLHRHAGAQCYDGRAPIPVSRHLAVHGPVPGQVERRDGLLHESDLRSQSVR